MNRDILWTSGQIKALVVGSVRIKGGGAGRVPGDRDRRERTAHGVDRRHGLGRRLHLRGEQPEFRFLFRDRVPRLPVWRDGRLQVVRWGNGRGQSRHLPRTGWTWLQTIQEGGWRNSGAIPVDIPAMFGLERRGIWYLIEGGIRGLLAPDERGFAVAYMICEPASHYYQIMTGSDRMPVLIDQRI